MSFNHTTNSVCSQYKELQKSINRDIEKLIANATTTNRILKDYSSLVGQSHEEELMGIMKDLLRVKKKTASHLQCFQFALESDENLSKSFSEAINSIEESVSIDESSSSEIRKLQEACRQQPTEDDIEVVEAEEHHIDPLTRTSIKQPVRNRRCHHLYCYKTIIPYIRSVTFPRCPIAGCSLPHIREDDLVHPDGSSLERNEQVNR